MVTVEKQRHNPWTVEQRTIVAQIVNEALTLSLDADAIVGCVTDGERCLVVWKFGTERHNFWFQTSWFRSRVEHKMKEKEVIKECAKRKFTVEKVLGKEKTFCITRNNRFVGIIGYTNRGWYTTRCSGNGLPIYVKNLSDGILSLWMLEVATVA